MSTDNDFGANAVDYQHIQSKNKLSRLKQRIQLLPDLVEQVTKTFITCDQKLMSWPCWQDCFNVAVLF